MSPSSRQGARRLPASGNSALAASALIQATLGIEFVLSGLNKFADKIVAEHGISQPAALSDPVRAPEAGSFRP